MNSLGRNMKNSLTDQYGPENGEASPQHTNGPTADDQ